MPRHALPTPNHLQRLADALPPGAAAAVAARGLCASPGPTVHLTLLPGEPAQLEAVDLPALGDGLLRPALARLASAAATSSSSVLLPPPLPKTQWDEGQQAHVLPAAAAAAWAQHLQLAAWEAGGSAQAQQAAHVLLYVPPRSQQPLLFEPAGGSGEAGSSLQLAGGSLLLAANKPAGSSSSERQGSSSEGASGSGELEPQLARRILSWLLYPLLTPGSHDGSAAAAGLNATVTQLQHSLAAACAADAATLLQRAVAAAAAAHEQPVTAGMASRAAEAVRLLQAVAGAPQAGEAAAAPLAAALGAWAAAQQLLRDPASGARPAFPPEHALAVLLPLSLPVTLVLGQAAARQASAWKKRRRQGRQQPSGGEDVHGAAVSKSE